MTRTPPRDRCFDVSYGEHTKRMCKFCPRRILSTPETRRPRHWREEALESIDPLHLCAFMLRDHKIAPQTEQEKRDNAREFYRLEREMREKSA